MKNVYLGLLGQEAKEISYTGYTRCCIPLNADNWKVQGWGIVNKKEILFPRINRYEAVLIFSGGWYNKKGKCLTVLPFLHSKEAEIDDAPFFAPGSIHIPLTLL